MPGNPQQKSKIIYIAKILKEQTDRQHALSTVNIIKALQSYGVSAERKAVYRDIARLRECGMNIEYSKKGQGGYYFSGSVFSPAEAQILIDAVCAASFITQRKTEELKNKIKSFVSEPESEDLLFNMIKQNKSRNEMIFYNISILSGAVRKKRKVSFEYFERKISDGAVREISAKKSNVTPISIFWRHDNYYLFAKEKDGLKRYRIDRIRRMEYINEPADETDEFNMLRCNGFIFDGSEGREQVVCIRCSNTMIDSMLERLGENVKIISDGSDHFIIKARVYAGDEFVSWILGLSGEAEIIGPRELRIKINMIADKIAQVHVREPKGYFLL